MLKRPFYGWIIVASLFTINFATMATGTLTFGLFVLPMSISLHMSRGFMGWAQTARMLSGGASSYLIGKVLDRHGARLLISIAAVLTFVCMVGLSLVRHPWQFLLFFSMMGLMGFGAPGDLLTSVPISKWFIQRRGTALAISTMGLGIGGIAFMPVTQFMIHEFGWRNTWLILGILSGSVIVPVAIIFLRRQPEDIGLLPYGINTDIHRHDESPTIQGERTWTASEALHTKAFWQLTLFFGILGFCSGSGSIHRLPYWIEKGFDSQLVALSFSADAAGAGVMALVSGLLVDKVQVRYVAAISCLGFATAVSFMLIGSNVFFLFGSGILFGTAVGTNMVIMSYIWARYYGRTFLGTIQGIVLPATLITNGIGAPIAGYVYDAWGSYVPVWWLILLLYLVAAILVTSIVPPQVIKNHPSKISGHKR